MNDRDTARPPSEAPDTAYGRLSKRIDTNKLSPPIVLAFFAALALMCAAAAGVGYLLPHIAKH